MIEHDYQSRDPDGNIIKRKIVHLRVSRWLNICPEHAKRLPLRRQLLLPDRLKSGRDLGMGGLRLDGAA